ncbi:MAG: DNA polymerase, partial [Alteriqipengyuania sp.]
GASVCSVALRQISEKVRSLVFAPVQAAEAVTAAERFVEVGVLRKDDDGALVFEPKSMSRECAGMLLASPQFRDRLPEIIRILDVRLPIADGSEIIFPEIGYDPRFRSYCPPGAAEPEPMGLDEAKQVLKEIHAEFCWKDAQSFTHALARLVTPYCRGLMGWDARLPLWHFAANRPRAGKDYLAGVTQLVYEGRTCEDSPLDRDSEETRKRITAALMSGRRTMHFANCQGYIQDQHFIGAITSKTFAARNLGSTEARADLVLPNEIEFSLSANVGLTFREDVEPRTRRIALEFYDENPNSRDFTRPDLHGWVLENRPRILGAVAALVQHWIGRGCPPGPTPFNSFPEWSRVVGGIMVTCDLGDPCLAHENADDLGGDRQERAMRAIYEIGHENHPDEWIEKSRLFELLDLAADDQDALAFFAVGGDLTSREAKTRIGKALRQFKGRELGGVQLLIDDHGKGQRQAVKFAQPTAPDRLDLDAVFGKVGKVEKVHARQKLERSFEDKALPYELSSTDVKSSGEPSSSSRPSTPSRETIFCTALVDLDRVAAGLKDAARIALDLETCGDRRGDALNPWRGDIRLLTLAAPAGPVWILDLKAIGYDLGPLKAILEEAEIVAHNAKFDLLWLRAKCGLDCRRVFCTLTAARLLTAGTRPGNTLDDCLKRHLGIEPGPDHARSDWGSPLLTPDQIAYASRDVAHLHDLAGVLERELEMHGLDEAWELEKSLLPCVIDMEFAGIAVDREKLKGIAARHRAIADECVDALRAEVGEPQLNPSSPTQLLAVLRSCGLDLKSTREEELKQTDDGRLIPLVLRYRAAEKRAQQAEALLGHVANDGRIHARFEPTGTATGRFSSKEPNLQNVGRGELREAFVAAH